MTDEPTTDTNPEPSSTEQRESAHVPTNNRHSRGHWAGADLREKLSWVALAVLGIVALTTLYQFYVNVVRTIHLWVAPKYEPAVQGAFALVVLCVSLVGIVRLTRQLSE